MILKGTIGRRLYASQKSLKDQLVEKIKYDPDQAFKYQEQRAIGIANLPNHIPKHAKDLALSEPWRGQESVADASLRMLVDTHKPLKMSRSQRISKAREDSLDYKYNTDQGNTVAQRVKSSKGSSGLSGEASIESLAEKAIDAAMAKGEFTNLKGRGKPMIKDPHFANPFVSTTESLLNGIIKRQGAAPPWIMKQSALMERIAFFRHQMRAELCQVHLDGIVEKFRDQKQRLDHAHRMNFDSDEWRSRFQEVYTVAINDINSQTRSYNLQAPTSARKGYLDVNQEMEKCVEDMIEAVPRAVLAYGTLGIKYERVEGGEEGGSERLEVGWFRKLIRDLTSGPVG